MRMEFNGRDETGIGSISLFADGGTDPDDIRVWVDDSFVFVSCDFGNQLKGSIRLSFAEADMLAARIREIG